MSPQNPMRFGYRPELDGVRALAILAVVSFHAGLLRGGFVGVDLFFVLSGFLITSLLLSEWQAHGTIQLGAFYGRRALRLLPALLALLLALWLGVWFFGGRFRTDPRLMSSTTLYTLAYVSNWVLALGKSAWPANLDHVWSLSIEEQFYLCWPVLLWLLVSRRVPRRAIASLLLLAIVACALWRAHLWHRTGNFARVYYATDTRADGLLLGCLTSVLATGRSSRWWLGTTGLLCFGAFVVSDVGTAAMCYGGFTAVSLASALLVSAPPAWLSHPSLVWVGRRSYAIYLWHYPVFYAVQHLPHALPQLDTVVAISLSVGIAAASFRYIEAPALRLKKRFAARAALVRPRPVNILDGESGIGPSELPTPVESA